MKKSRGTLRLHRETLHALTASVLGHVAGATMIPCQNTITCGTNCAGYTCLPCTNGGGSGVYTTCCTGPYTGCGC
jgi:hypothetical protein